MTETTEWFNFKDQSMPVRVLDKNNFRWMPLIDIANCTGYDRSNLNKLVERNKLLFEGKMGMVSSTTPSGHQELMCVNHDGFVGLLMKIDYAHIKNKERQEKIVLFQKWGIDLLSSVVKGEVVTSPHKRVSITAAVREGKDAARSTKADPRECVAASLKQHGYDYYIPILPSSNILMPPKAGEHRVVRDQTTLLRPALGSGSPPQMPEFKVDFKDIVAPSPKPEGMLSATDIGLKIQKTPEQVNQFLYNRKMIIHDGLHESEWRLCADGAIYGCEVPYKPRPDADEVHRIFWYPKVLELFNVKV